MNLSFRLYLSISLFISAFASAQELPCGSSQINNEMLRLYPEKAALAEQMNRETLEYTLENYGQNRSVVPQNPSRSLMSVRASLMWLDSIISHHMQLKHAQAA